MSKLSTSAYFFFFTKVTRYIEVDINVEVYASIFELGSGITNDWYKHHISSQRKQKN